MSFPPNSDNMSFRHYILTRKYHHGRGSDEGWAFIALALGDPGLPDAQTWQELRSYLVQRGTENPMLKAADIVWRSYISHLSRQRRVSGTASHQGHLVAYAGSMGLRRREA